MSRMEPGKGTDQGVGSQVMLLTGCEILTKQVFLSGGDDRPHWVETQRVVVDWPVLLRRFWASG